MKAAGLADSFLGHLLYNLPGSSDLLGNSSDYERDEIEEGTVGNRGCMPIDTGRWLIHALHLHHNEPSPFNIADSFCRTDHKYPEVNRALKGL